MNATNADGTDSKTEMLLYKGRVSLTDTSTGASQTPNSTGSSSTAIGNRAEVICHKSANAAPVTITISVNLLPFHLSHGDTKGACPTVADTVNVAPIKPRTIPIRDNDKGEKQDSTQKETPLTPTTTPRRPR